MKKVRTNVFSLIEMLVVIAIIVVLISLLNPALRKAIESASQVSCINKSKQIGLAFQSYASDHKDFLPAINWEGEEEWQQDWAGFEIAENMGVTQSSKGEGVIWDYMQFKNNNPSFRCYSLDDGSIGDGIMSNGSFDYSALDTFSGAKLHNIPSKSHAFVPTAPGTQSPAMSEMFSVATPLIVEEDPAQNINSGIIDLGHGNQDQMGTWHDNRTSINPSMVAVTASNLLKEASRQANGSLITSS